MLFDPLSTPLCVCVDPTLTPLFSRDAPKDAFPAVEDVPVVSVLPLNLISGAESSIFVGECTVIPPSLNWIYWSGAPFKKPPKYRPSAKSKRRRDCGADAFLLFLSLALSRLQNQHIPM